jgi:UDP-2,3-diacylglucosamine pyrophosphatase LpxH
LQKLGRDKISLSKKIKDSVKQAVQFIDNFEETAAGIAIDNGYDYVVCGHIHKPAMKTITTDKGSVMYLNSGDWVENLTALECQSGNWRIYNYRDDKVAQSIKLPRRFKGSDNKELFNEMMEQLLKPKK